MTNHVMLDIETLDTEQTAVVTEIGIIIFDDTFNRVDKYVLQLEIVPQIFMGRTISQDTIKWWGQQDKTLVEKFISPDGKLSPKEALSRILSTLPDLLTKESLLWANGIMFDVGIVDSLCQACEEAPLSSLFFYRNVRDYRTLYQHAVMSDKQAMTIYADGIDKGTSHSALDDCEWQLSMLENLYAILQVVD